MNINGSMTVIYFQRPACLQQQLHIIYHALCYFTIEGFQSLYTFHLVTLAVNWHLYYVYSATVY